MHKAKTSISYAYIGRVCIVRLCETVCDIGPALRHGGESRPPGCLSHVKPAELWACQLNNHLHPAERTSQDATKQFQALAEMMHRYPNDIVCRETCMCRSAS
jgi:hypothetical protein